MTPTLAPVTTDARLVSVDVVRGFALLGILTMNIITFGLPMSAYVNPMSEGLAPFAGRFEGLNAAAWWINHLLFDQKMMALFSMLFGGGLVLMDSRAPAAPGGPGAKPRGFARVYYRRLAWLFLVGMTHAYVLWFGDILVAYALCGLLLYPLRRLTPRALLIVGAVVFSIAAPLSVGFGALIGFAEGMVEPTREKLARGETLTPEEQTALNDWDKGMADFDPTPEQAAAEVASMRGSYAEVFTLNAQHTVFMQTLFFVTWALWRGLGLMLIGMALAKLGFFAGAWSARRYIIIAVAGYAIGLPLVALGGLDMITHKFDMARLYLVSGHFNYFASVVVALAHASVILLVVRAGALAWLTARLAAVGRMALTNYLMQTVIATTVFFGWGLGQFGTLERWQLWLPVLGIWTFQLAFSPLWLARFRFGPAEWLWRTLTYWKLQPMRVSPH